MKKYNKFSERLLRGGFWRTIPGLCRSACRFPPLLGLVGGNVGLLVVCLPPWLFFYRCAEAWRLEPIKLLIP